MYQDLKLSDRARVIEMAVRSGITDLDTIEQVYNTFAQGGDLEEPAERRKVGDHYLTLEQYKELQRDTIRQAAVQKALTRTRGVAPIINGKPALSCIYTFTDNYGRKYQVAGTQTFAANPEKYGFEVAGPVTEGMEGNMYLQLNESGVPYHATMITGYTDTGEPLLTYSSGHAGVDLTGVPISREDWDRNQRAAESLQRIAGLTPERETYEHYVERFNRSHSPEADYHKNTKAWHSPQYETYRFIGTPDDNALWEQQFNEFQPALIQVGVPQVLNNQVQTEFKSGGQKKRETAYARKYREEQIAKTRRAIEHPTLGNVFRNDTTDNNEKYYDIVKSRYDSIMGALRRKGFSYEDASRLAPMMVTQNVLEGGWRMSRPDNNFGGMQVNGRFLSFDSPDDYYDAYIDMLDQKWGQSKVKSKNWRYAENLNDWARIVNHEDLNLWSEERYNDYIKEHPNESLYLYAPEWQNNYKPYRQHLAGVEPRVNTYLDMILEESPYTKEMYNAPAEPVAQPNDGFNLSMDQFQKLLKSNKSDGHMAKGGKLYGGGGNTDDDGIYLGELQPAIVKPNPVAVRLYTDPITKRTPITHSSLEMSEMGPVLGAGHSFFVSKGSNDPTYSLFTRNCSDATGEILEAISGQDFTSGITTPWGVRRKAREVFGDYPGYFEGVGPDYGADSPHSTVQYFEIPWYDYRVARDIATKRRAESIDKSAEKAGLSDEKRKEIIQYIYNDSPLLPYRLNEKASGGKIHIKPENRGKFTALKKRTGHSASWFKAHGTPAQKKMAVFALNAKKWKHGNGGYLMTKL